MNFDYNEEQQLLADSVRRYLQKDYDFEARRKVVASQEGWSERAWSTFAEMGLTGLPVSTDYGGFGGGAVDLMGVMEAFGEALVVEPYLASVLAARLLAQAGSAEQKQALLPAVAEGSLKLAFAHDEPGARHRPGHVNATAKKSGGQWILEGEKRGVLGAPAAARLVVSAKSAEGTGLYLVEAAAVQMKPFRTLDEMRAADIVLRGAKAERLGATPDSLALIEEATDFATALVCAEAVGAMKFACDTTLEYLKTRKQFGVPIGTFQALQHRMVDMFIAYEQAKSMACLACSKADAAENETDRKRSVSAAKIKVADNARHISQESVQLHGGMGMSEELKVSHSFRRLTVAAEQFGGADYHLERFASL
ncbi:MAG TPA: acyl-CoA dehydrogenase family protein [Burkholderiales bacterium]|nr:acyl-CoA dehydrogenase family protein [Burkholderiales bacterium]